jgi:3-mercaptopyruvate sulfurtransferase SseA
MRNNVEPPANVIDVRDAQSSKQFAGITARAAETFKEVNAHPANALAPIARNREFTAMATDASDRHM